MRIRSLAPAALVLIVASLTACGARVRPEMVARVDRVLADHTLSEAEWAPPADLSIIPWEVGQWAVYRTRDSKGNIGVQRQAIVRQDSCGIWLETISQTVSERNRTSMCFSRAPDFSSRNEQAIRNAMDLVMVMETQNDDGKVEVTDLRLPENAMMRPMLRSMGQYIFFSAETSASPREDIRVPAGNFRQAFVFKTQLQMGPFRRDFTNWGHPVVPINGLVRSIDDSGSSDIDLVAWGTGATDLETPWPAP